MSYYKYLNKYSPAFLRKYQTETYAHLQRQNMFHDIVNMNATNTLTVDEDLTLRFRVPFSIANLIGAAALVYWYMTHANMFSANTIRNRMRSYHNYKMWSRLEVLAHKHSCESGHKIELEIQERYLQNYNITRQQLDDLISRTKAGEDLEEVLKSMGIQWDAGERKFLPISQT